MSPENRSNEEILLARIAAVEARIAKISEWAYANHGGVKSPAEVWPGLAALLAASPTPTGPEPVTEPEPATCEPLDPKETRE